jgi:protein involved in polysaccharide export with SLBB domain
VFTRGLIIGLLILAFFGASFSVAEAQFRVRKGVTAGFDSGSLGPGASDRSESAQPEDGADEAEITDRLKADVPEILPFGSNLFTGNFVAERDDGLNPDYVVMTGDRVVVQTWGAVVLNETLIVDGQGNIFLPDVGPVQLADRRNEELTGAVKQALSRVYRSNFGVYTNLLSAQPVGVYVTGFVKHPGRYAGLPTDSVLYFLDRAGGIDTDLGSYRHLTAVRGTEVIATFDLYDFLLDGRLPRLHFQDGDTILVGPRGPVVELAGSVARPALVEMKAAQFTGGDVLDVVPESARATEVTVMGVRDGKPFNATSSLVEFRNVKLQRGDTIELRDDGSADKILVRLEGEFNGPSVLAVRRGARLLDLLNYVPVDPELVDTSSIHILRKSVQASQQRSLEDSLFRLERSTLLALSASIGESNIRQTEADLVLSFVERAREVQPIGRVVTTVDGLQQNILLEDGDIIVIPRRTSVVEVDGEVLIAQAILHRPGDLPEDYVRRAGGYSDRADKGNFIIVHASGEVTRDPETEIRAGDQVVVMPDIDEKGLQQGLDVAQIIARLAISAGIFIGL